MRTIVSNIRSGILSFLFILAFAGVLRAQVPPIYIGGGIDVGMNFHKLNLPVYLGDTICGVFQSGTSILPGGFLLYERPLGEPASSLWIAPRVHLSGLGALITTPATEQARARNPVDSSLVNTTRVHQLSATFLSLGADLFVKYPLSSRFFLMGGPSISYLLRRDVNQTEAITSPAQAVFTENGQQTRTLYSGEIPNGNNILASFTLGGSLDIPVSNKVVLAPELSATMPFNSLRKDYSWRVITAAAGIALKFNVASEPSLQVVTPPPPPPPERPKSKITASVQIAGVTMDSMGIEHEIPHPQIRIEEFVRRESYPTLNYIFFSEGSTEIPSRYHLLPSDNGTAPFDPSKLEGKGTLDVYYETLNILGERLQKNPSIRVTLTGSKANTSTEMNALDLSKARAESVKKYFVNVWKIDPARISVQAVNLPNNASPTDTKEGAEENRRVEITSNNPNFLDPLVIENADRTMNPPKIRLHTTEASNLPLIKTSIALQQASRVVLNSNEVKATQDWTPSVNDLPRTDTPLVATLYLQDSNGASVELHDTARVEQITIQKKRQERVKDLIIEHYNLITFDFNKADIGPRSQRIVDEIARNVTPKDAIALKGYTDMTGESQHNLALSEQRASNVEAALKQTVGAKGKTITFSERGEGELDLVDNRLPEGRFLSRTVFVQVTRPVE